MCHHAWGYFWYQEKKIAESALDEDNVEVTTTIAAYIARKLFKRSKYESCNISIKVWDVDTTNDPYLNILSHGGLFVTLKSLAEFICSNFATLDFVQLDSLSLTSHVKTLATDFATLRPRMWFYWQRPSRLGF